MMERDGLFRKSAQQKFTRQAHKHEKESLTSKSKESPRWDFMMLTMLRVFKDRKKFKGLELNTQEAVTVGGET